MDVCEAKDIHPDRTDRGQRSYCFTPKHHGAGLSLDACWLRDLPRPEEFEVFNMADQHELSDASGNLYGLRIRNLSGRRELLELGTQHEQIARFWAESQQNHWHGHPLWPVDARETSNRGGQDYRPPRLVFQKIVAASIFSKTQAGRLNSGKHVRKL
jgi:hypothetical protein